MKKLVKNTTVFCLIFGGGMGVGAMLMFRISTLEPPDIVIKDRIYYVKDPRPEYKIVYNFDDDRSWVNNSTPEEECVRHNFPCPTTTTTIVPTAIP